MLCCCLEVSVCACTCQGGRTRPLCMYECTCVFLKCSEGGSKSECNSTQTRSWQTHKSSDILPSFYQSINLPKDFCGGKDKRFEEFEVLFMKAISMGAACVRPISPSPLCISLINWLYPHDFFHVNPCFIYTSSNCLGAEKTTQNLCRCLICYIDLN